MIWIVLISGALLCTVFIPFRHGARKPVTWAQLIDGGTLDDVPNTNELLKTFFLPDSINPADFLANYVELSGSPPATSPDEAGKPTTSAAAFDKGVKAPPGYPRWFLAAYPDVVLWLSSQDEMAMLRISAEALYGAEGAKELIRIHGVERIGELMDEKFEEFDLAQLRRLVTIFGGDTRKRLECALATKEKRPRRWWFESNPKRLPTTDLIGQRIVGDFHF